KPLPDWWPEHERQRGTAQSLERELGKSTLYNGIATVEAAETKTVYVNVGADVRGVWLNGKKIYTSSTWKGWHLGRERAQVELKPGKNTLILEAGGPFILSVTDGIVW